MFGFNFNKEKDTSAEEKHELEQFFESEEDWDIGHKGGEVEKEQGEIDWSNYDFMHTFDDLPQSNRPYDSDEE